MKKLKVPSVAMAALLAAGMFAAPAFAQDEQPAEPETTTTDSDAGGEQAPAE